MLFYSQNITNILIQKCKNWASEIKQACNDHSECIVLDGDSITSYLSEENCNVNVVNGVVVFEKLRWLYDLYVSDFLKIANSKLGDNYCISNNLEASININMLFGEGAFYEPHVDSNPLTGLIFCETLSLKEGGKLVFQNGLEILPQKGDFLLFDARNEIHWVEPLHGEGTCRISLPMNYYIKGEDQSRPSDLNSYLYSKK